MSTTRGELGGARSGSGLRPETVAPSCFASVMATGIVSIGAHLKGLTLAAATQFWLAVALYIFFIVLTAWRAVSHRAALRADLHNPKKAFGFFTFIAATNVLATALEGQSHLGAASALLGIGLLFWLVLGYGIPFTAILGADSRPVSASVNGTWFVWVVAAQSVAVAASGLASAMPGAAATSGVGAALAIIAVMMWAVGIGLYVACVVFLGVRTIVHRIGPADLDAPFWVTMGALAISVVAGSRIMEIDSSPMPTATRFLIGGTSVLLGSDLSIASFGESEAGEVLVVDLGGGIYRLAP